MAHIAFLLDSVARNIQVLLFSISRLPLIPLNMGPGLWDLGSRVSLNGDDGSYLIRLFNGIKEFTVPGMQKLFNKW